MIQKYPRITHYGYMCGPDGIREVIATYDLTDATLDRRRKVVHRCLKGGYLLAASPIETNSLQKLREEVNRRYPKQ